MESAFPEAPWRTMLRNKSRTAGSADAPVAAAAQGNHSSTQVAAATTAAASAPTEQLTAQLTNMVSHLARVATQDMTAAAPAEATTAAAPVDVPCAHPKSHFWKRKRKLEDVQEQSDREAASSNAEAKAPQTFVKLVMPPKLPKQLQPPVSSAPAAPRVPQDPKMAAPRVVLPSEVPLRKKLTPVPPFRPKAPPKFRQLAKVPMPSAELSRAKVAPPSAKSLEPKIVEPQAKQPEPKKRPVSPKNPPRRTPKPPAHSPPRHLLNN